LADCWYRKKKNQGGNSNRQVQLARTT
jgi:hypothetical protein